MMRSEFKVGSVAFRFVSLCKWNAIMRMPSPLSMDGKE